ncbi:MAG: SDR family oxidoreductase [Anaerolineae bacterium]|nr:SDR family oxidoreductase [Anaerolineae bacterium]
MKKLAGKLALITGGSSGIGLALAKELAVQGMRVAILARRKEVLDAAQTEIAPLTPFDVRTIVADVSDWEQVSAVLDSFQAEVGVPDLVINSAGVARPGQFEDLDVEIFHWTLDINLLGPIHVCKAVVPGMLKRGSGHIVNISSVAGFVGTYGYTAYGASKFGLRGFSDTLRAELRSRGITVSIVFPPDTDTPQLAAETPYKPAVTKALAETASVQHPEKVAVEIRKGIQKNRILIIPGFEGKLIYLANNLPFNLGYHLMDMMVSGAEKSAGKKLNKAG